jgi:hypothetical protein
MLLADGPNNHTLMASTVILRVIAFLSRYLFRQDSRLRAEMCHSGFIVNKKYIYLYNKILYKLTYLKELELYRCN